MKSVVLIVLALTALASGCNYKTGPMPPVEIYFSPKGGCEEAVVRALDAAKETVFVQAYSFTNRAIAQALLHAQKRGVDVHVIVDKSVVKDRYSEADFMANSGIAVLIDSQHPIAHNKIMIIDRAIVITGSFNFTNQAELYNAENLLVIHDPGMAERYLENWQVHEAHSDRYTGRGEVAEESNDRQRRGKKRQGLFEE